MKKIVFRPLRRIKKTGRIVVASYASWNKIRCADYNKFSLVVDNEYATMSKDEYVYNSQGEQLFWRDYNPADVPVFNNSPIFDLGEVLKTCDRYGISWDADGRVNYVSDGMDCQGTPTFSHYTADYTADYEGLNDFEPLTVGMVVKWFGWFLYQLDNSYLQIGK